MDTEFNSCRCLAALVGSRKKMAANAVLTADEERELQDGLHEIAAIEKSEWNIAVYQQQKNGVNIMSIQ